MWQHEKNMLWEIGLMFDLEALNCELLSQLITVKLFTYYLRGGLSGQVFQIVF